LTAQRFCKGLKGVFGFPATPFRRDLSVDLDALARNVDAMASHPFCAIVAAGGMGELYSLSPNEIGEVVRVTVDAVAGRMPVIAGTAFNWPIARAIVAHAEASGVEAFLVLPPYGPPVAPQGLASYYEEIGHATALPLVIYSRDAAVFTPDQAARLCDRIPTLGGWKDGQPDLRLFRRIMHKIGDRLAWYGGMGDDYTAEYFAIGAQAFTSSISNFAPKLSIALLGPERDELLRRYVLPLFSIRARVRGYDVAAIKTAMEMVGITAGPVRPPLPNLLPDDAEDLRALMEVYAPVL
jgi:5-dehydro-4-deoxyglucarate dehydratase